MINDNIIQEIKEKGKYVVRGFGTFIKKPARKGVVYTKYGNLETKNKFRIAFKPSKNLIKKVNE